MNLLQRLRGGVRSDEMSPDDFLAHLADLQWGFMHGPAGKTGDTESAAETFVHYVAQAYRANGIVFACMLTRLLVFSEARFAFRRLHDGRPGELFATDALRILERPWTNGTTGELLTRMIQDVDLAGNAYIVRRPGRKLKRLRPDWVEIVIGTPRPNGTADDLDAEVVGFIYYPGGTEATEGVVLDVEEVAHWAPIPDPLAHYRGMSWLTPVLREIEGDGEATRHKLAFFRNAATPNLVVSFKPEVKQEAFEKFKAKLEQKHRGATNAYRTLYLGGGADVTVVGTNFRDMAFKDVQGHGETRVAAAAGVPPIIVGLSEGLASATYSNYGQARRRFADGTMRPLWRSACAALTPLVEVPADAELWTDDDDILFLQEDRKDAADILRVNAASIRTLTDGGYTPESVIAAVQAENLSLLEHSGLMPVQLQPPGEDDPTEPKDPGGDEPGVGDDDEGDTD